MSEFNLIWRRYNLKGNPYFLFPLSVYGNIIGFSSFTGREKEVEQLKKVINQGSVRYLVVGNPGVGKTSLVNFVRNKASEEQYFTLSNEIELNKSITCNEFIIITLSAIYDEVKRIGIILSNELTDTLESFYSLTQLSETSEAEGLITHLNYNKLIQLFRETVKEIIYPRFKGIILHYDNLDNIKNPNELLRLFGEIRDVLLTSQNIIFLFVGDRFLPKLIALQPRVRQTFLMPGLEVEPLTLEDIKKILEIRVNELKSNEKSKPICPHTNKALQILFKLHNGNLREILNSLSNCILELASSNYPIKIDDVLLRKILSEKAKKTYLSKLTDVEKKILFDIIDRGVLTPSEIAKVTHKSRQNISSKYIPKLESVGAIEFKGSESRNSYYEVAPEIKWCKLEIPEKEMKELNEKRNKKVSSIIDTKLSDFM